MNSILRSILPVSHSNRTDHDEYNVEYSFAMEYSGPPVAYDIPRLTPVDVEQIPIAVASTDSMLSSLSLPVMQPIVKSITLKNKLSKGSNLGPEVVSPPKLVTRSGEFDGCGAVLSSKSVDVVDSEGALGLIEGDNCIPQVLDGNGIPDGSRELSGSSDVDGIRDDCEEGEVFRLNYSNPARTDLNESGSSSPSLSSEIFSCEEEDCIDEAPNQVNRMTVVTFHDPESREIVSDETDHDEPEIVQERKVAGSNVKKGLCHRCLKGSRFTEKEICIVCSAKYCSKCVLRAMGSMPEGRKCIACIGFRIDESKRDMLGKCSRMLKRLFTDSQVKHVMRLEISCEANQLPPELIFVNGKPLCYEEFFLLQSCPNPPKKLRPGMYWYDKVSGLWGKEGHKPYQIITPQLAVGGAIMRNASNGNTKILINNREITKQELLMLKLSGIHCEGSPHYWLSPDGSCQEEGQKNVMGKIWDKTGIKLVCAVMSLPTPPESANPSEEEANNVADKVLNNLEQNTLNKILLVGYDQSGTSTIFKQARIIYNVPFSENERQNVKFVIQSNLYSYIGILLEGRERFEEEWLMEVRRKYIDVPGPSERAPDQIAEENIYSISPRLKAFSDWLLQVMMSGNLEAIFLAATREYAPFVEELWKDKAFQATYSRRQELHMLPRVANYFLDRAVEISRTDYEPSDMDILYAEGIASSNGLACVEFSFPKSAKESFLDSTDQNDPLPSYRYQLIRVHVSSLGEHCKWLEMFEDVDLVVYCVSLIDYDQFTEDCNGVRMNKMLESKKLFESIITHPTCANKDFLLILNKFDLLEQKIEQFPLTQCEWFNDFNPVMSHRQSNNNNGNQCSMAQHAIHYIALKFKRLFGSLTGRKLYVSSVTGLEADSVDEVLQYGREILKWDREKPVVNMNEYSTESLEASTFS